MALKTMRDKFEAAKAEHQAQLKKLGSGFQKEICAALSALLPEGWHLHWQHSDQQYNDEDYYWDIGHAYIVTDLKPRRGKLLKEKTETTYNEVAVRYGYGGGTHLEKQIDVYGSEAEYEWILDDQCKPRSKSSRSRDYYEDEGATNLKHGEDNSSMKFGLKKVDISELVSLFYSLTQDDLTLAFGSEATVTVRRDGSCEVV